MGNTLTVYTQYGNTFHIWCYTIQFVLFVFNTIVTHYLRCKLYSMLRW